MRAQATLGGRLFPESFGETGPLLKGSATRIGSRPCENMGSQCDSILRSYWNSCRATRDCARSPSCARARKYPESARRIETCRKQTTTASSQGA
jgi:hypothetical protein